MGRGNATCREENARSFAAIGAATRPPVASSPMEPPRSTITDTAYCGFSAGAKDTNHACGVQLSQVWAVPVLPATVTPAIAAERPVPWGLFTTCTMKSRIVVAVACRHRLLPLRGVDRRDDAALVAADLGGHMRLHDRTTVRDRRRDEVHLQRRGRDLALPDAGEREQWLVVVERARLRTRAHGGTGREVERRLRVDAEAAHVRRELLTEREAQRGERRVARPHEALLEGPAAHARRRSSESGDRLAVP